VPAGSFYRYWTTPAPPTPEEMAVEATALAQVMARLEPAQAQALLALAEYGDYEAAAAALKLSQTAFNARVRRGRAAFLALWHEHEAVPGRWRTDKRLYRRVSRSEPADRADAARSLADIRDAFGGRAAVASTDLLARLAAADPGRYGTWDCHDLGALLCAHGVARHRIPVDGDDRKRVGYRLADIIRALEDLTAPGALAREAAWRPAPAQPPGTCRRSARTRSAPSAGAKTSPSSTTAAAEGIPRARTRRASEATSAVPASGASTAGAKPRRTPSPPAAPRPAQHPPVLPGVTCDRPSSL
jgi:hypothetical protein